MKLIIDDTKLTNIADSLRNKLDTEEEFTPDDMADAIENMSSGVDGQYISFAKSEGSDVVDTAVYNGFEKITLFDSVERENIIVNEGTTSIQMSSEGGEPDETVKKITLPTSLITIERAAFAYYRELTEINIPENVTSIGAKAFVETQLKTIFIPSTVKTISAGTVQNAPFLNCYILTDIYTDAASKPSGWGTHFNKLGYGSDTITVHYGVSREEYEEIIESEDA